MAEIHVEKKKAGSSAWIWILIVILALAALGWWLWQSGMLGTTSAPAAPADTISLAWPAASSVLHT